MTRTADVLLPAPSSATTVIVFSPGCTGMEEIDQAASRLVPIINATPLATVDDPLMAVQLTRYSNLLSEARPAAVMTPGSTLSKASMETRGASRSIVLQCRRCAESNVGPTPLTAITDSPSAGSDS